jgi:hypothetical protein
MAPEQIEGRRATGRTDQFSFCVALYAALYDQRPFAGDRWLDLTGQVLAGAVREPPPGEVPDWVFGVIRRGLTVRPRERWPSMDAMVQALERGLRGRPEGSPTRVRLAVVTIVLALVALAVAMVVAI